MIVSSMARIASTLPVHVLVIFSIINAINCNVYYVTSDHHYCDISSHHCGNLQSYLLNTSKYFTPHTQLVFLPGLHHLSVNFTIQNVHNISIIGRTANGVITTIQCSAMELFIIITNVTQLMIKDIVVTDCGENVSSHVYVIPYHYGLYTMQLYQCSSVTIQNFKILSRTIYDSLISINTISHSMFHNIISSGVTLVYNNFGETNESTDSTVFLVLDHFQYTCAFTCPPGQKITVRLSQTLFDVHVNLTNINLCSQHYTVSIDIFMTTYGYNFIEINHCTCSQVTRNFDVTLIDVQDKLNNVGKWKSIVHIKNCHFINVIYDKLLIIKTTSSCTSIHITDCTFTDTSNVIILDSGKRNVYNKDTILIKNTTFVSMLSAYPLVHLSNQLLLLQGPVIFKDVDITGINSLFDIFHVSMHIYNYIEISNCSATVVTPNNAIYFILEHSATVNFTRNYVTRFTDNIFSDKYSACTFQFFSDYHVNFKFKENEKLNFSIVFNANHWDIPLDSDMLKINHCAWLPGSVFYTTLPSVVNHHIITFINETFVTINKSLCYCSDKYHIDCSLDELGPIYPGQTLNTMLACPTCGMLTPLIVDVYDSIMPATVCRVSFLQEANQFVGQTCTQLNFTITQATDNFKWCELSFGAPLTSRDGYYIKFYRCPTGFTKLKGECQCDPILKSNLLPTVIDDCDINDQTIRRPANSWISAVTNNNSHNYLISLHCPFDYCLPHSSHLKLSLSSDLQCQYRRSNLLCGRCSDGLSSVFGTSHCQKCSNTFLFVILPVALSGVILVVLLFLLNLTVVIGTINAFVLYINIVSINSTMFFPTHHDTSTSIAYAFISLANLDLGIELCFYNGMDDYSKMWLQLMYPLYLVLIAALLIMGSRYSTKIQRLTAHRALPVLATLFLLSYTKILRTVSNVLFSYSTIIQLPSGHSTIVWSVDANVKILGIKFIALFIVCLIIFLLLIPFNVTLLFTRSLLRFRIINHFKPLLDVYQGPYKDKFYFWTGLHLIIKAVFFGMSALDDTINLTASIVMLCAMVGFVGYSCPFKNSLQNCHEIIALLNLNTMCAFILSGQNVVAVNIMIALAAVHFVFIVIYHVINYTLGVTVKSRVQLFVFILCRKMSKVLSKKSPTSNVITHYSNEIPEITYNYSKYQEPLVGEDYT